MKTPKPISDLDKAYNAARDAYGNLSYAVKMKILDAVSLKTDMTHGDIAKQAFVDAYNEATKQTEFYYGFVV